MLIFPLSPVKAFLIVAVQILRLTMRLTSLVLAGVSALTIAAIPSSSYVVYE